MSKGGAKEGGKTSSDGYIPSKEDPSEAGERKEAWQLSGQPNKGKKDGEKGGPDPQVELRNHSIKSNPTRTN